MGLLVDSHVGEKPMTNSRAARWLIQPPNCNWFIFWLLFFQSNVLKPSKFIQNMILPEVLKRLTLLLWQIAGPLSWLVSIVVTFVLIPAAYANEPAKVEPSIWSV